MFGHYGSPADAAEISNVTYTFTFQNSVFLSEKTTTLVLLTY